MGEQTGNLFRRLILISETVISNGYRQLAAFDRVILAAKENPDSHSGFSFLVMEKNEQGKVIFRGITEEFQNASTNFVLRAGLDFQAETGQEPEL